MIGKISGMGVYSGLTMETTLDPTAQPFLNDHRIDGTPVLPGVMGIEGFAEAALFTHPGWYVETVEEVEFLAPFKFYRDEPRTLIIQETISPQGDRLVATCKLIGRRQLPNQSAPQETTHFTARVRLTKDSPQAAAGAAMWISSDAIVDAAQIYRIYFHGPAYQVVERAWWDGNHMIGLMAEPLPDNHEPADLPTHMAPRLIELCFQTAGLWQLGMQGQLGLPQHLGGVGLQLPPQSREGRLYAVVTPIPENGTFDAEVIDAAGNRYLRLNGYQTVAFSENVDVEAFNGMRTVTV